MKVTTLPPINERKDTKKVKMGKHRNSKRNNNSHHQNDPQNKRKQDSLPSDTTSNLNPNESYLPGSSRNSPKITPTAIKHPNQHIHNPFHSFSRIILCSLTGMLLGFGFGSGYLTGMNGASSPWRTALGIRIRSTGLYETLFGYPPMHSFHSNNVGGSTTIPSSVNVNGNNNPRKKKGTKYKTQNKNKQKYEEQQGYESFNAADMPIYSIPQYFWHYFVSPFYSFFMIPHPPYYDSYEHGETYGSFIFDNENDPPISIQNLPTPGLGTGPYDSSHPMMFAALRESVIREKGGFVHPDLGILTPAPCGASRGLGMVRNSYTKCQTKCFPGGSLNDYYMNDDSKAGANSSPSISPTTSTLDTSFDPEEILLKIPLPSQLTRAVALNVLNPLLPNEIRSRFPLEDLDDPILLALLLAHERGRFRESKYQAYISILPQNPTCGLGISTHQRKNLVEVLRTYEQEMGHDINGWHGEIRKAREYADRMTSTLSRDYGNFIIPNTDSNNHGNRRNGRNHGKSNRGSSNAGNHNSNHNSHTNNMSPYQLIQWALCTVASRGIQGSKQHGRMRLVPILDLINHDEEAAEVVELGADEQAQNTNSITDYHNDDDEDENNDYSWQRNLVYHQERKKKRQWIIDEDDAGAMVVRSMRYGSPKYLKKGQELLINYNVPHYSPLDWFINLGFIPLERSSRWRRLENALPRISRSEYARSAGKNSKSTKT